ncbi:MAG: radical SAM protein [Candidatus Marinimicrobia bacterium]|nr:radical SAM protein [Candidatus Neomarinimicrobiota bacterium]
MLEVTNHCNLKCITCPREYLFGDQMDKGHMNFEKLKKIVDEAYPYIDSIGLTGLGETLLFNDLLNAVNYIKRKSKGIIVSCSINAHLKNSVDIVNQLVDKIDTIQISMDGLGDIYDEIRVGGNFTFFQANLKRIVELTYDSETDILLNVVLLKENYHQMSKMIEFANNLKIKYISMVPINLVSITDEDISYYKLFFSEEFQKELENAKILAKEYEELEFTYPTLSLDEGFKTCTYPWNYFYISWDGLLPPCCAKPFPKELNLGNVFNNGLLNSINSKEFKEFRKLWYKNETPEFCEKCTLTIDRL